MEAGWLFPFVSSGPARGSQRHGADVQRGLGAATARHSGAEGREEQPEGCAECGEGAGARSQARSPHPRRVASQSWAI